MATSIRIGLLILFVFLGQIATLRAQEPVAIHLTEKDGLPDVEFYSVLEDHQGFIWLAADKGLFRYDGDTYKHYSNGDQQGRSVFGIKLDAQGRVWCNNIAGQFFYVEDDELVTFINLKQHLGGQLATFEFNENHLYVTNIGNFLKIDLDTKAMDSFTSEGNFLSEIYPYNNGFLFADTKGIKYFDCATEKITPFTRNRFQMHQNVCSFFQFQGRLFMVNHDFQKVSNTFYIKEGDVFIEIATPLELQLGRMVHFWEHEERLWISRVDGMYLCDFNDKSLVLDRVYFNEKYVTRVVKDRNANYWFPTLREGVYVVPNIHVEEYTDAALQNNISCLAKIDGERIAYGTVEGNVGIFNSKTHEVTPIKLLLTGKISALAYNHDKGILNISQEAGCYRYYLKEGVLVPYSLLFVNAKALSVVDETKMIYAAFDRAVIYDFTHLKATTFAYLGARRTYTSFHSKRLNKSYIAYVDGLVQYDASLKEVPLQFEGESIFAVAMTETEDGTLWVSTFNRGIIGIKNGLAVANYTETEGLVSNQTNKIKADGYFLWVATDKGIQLIDTMTGQVKTLTKRDGIVSYIISDIEVMKDVVVFACNKGLFTVDKASVFKDWQVPEPYFTTVTIGERDTIIQPSYKLPSDNNRIQFQFHANGFQSKEHVNYQYRLLGMDDTWSTTNKGDGQVRYNSLAPGKYRFQLRVAATNNEQVSGIQEIQLRIKLPFYKEWWFISSVVAFMGILIVLYYRRKLKIKEEEQQVALEKLEKDKELVFLKLENLRSQMNPHFIFNALNSIQEYIILNQKSLASDYLGKFADLIRTYLDHSRLGVISIQEEIQCLEMYLELEQLRFEDKFSYSIEVAPALTNLGLNIPTMLVQPYVENAIKHGLLHKKDNRKLNIHFDYDPHQNHVICVVEDNGVGIEKAKALRSAQKRMHKSFAFQATYDRLQLLNTGRDEPIGVYVEDVMGPNQVVAGTKVTICIPSTSA